MVAQPVTEPSPDLRIVPARRFGLYLRVSTSRQEEEGTSLDTQDAAGRVEVAARGGEIDEAHVYRETFSGIELWDRPKLTALRAAIRDHKIDAVVCYAIDRLSRDPVHLGVILSEAEHHGVAFYFVTEPLDESPEGQLIRFVRGYAAKIEHMKIRERGMRGKRARVDAGKVPNAGTDLYGYRKDRERGVRLIHDDEARVVRMVFRWYVDEGLSVRGIAARLNAEGIPAPSAGKRSFDAESGRSPRWGKTVIHRILTDPSYKGEGFAWRWQRATVKRTVYRPRDQWVRLPDGTVPAILEPAIWDAAQTRLDTNRGDGTRNEARPYLLRGVIVCAVCGRKMRADSEHGRRVYRCGSRDTAGGACGGKRVNADAVEAFVWWELEAFLSREETIREEIDRRRQAGPDRHLLADQAAMRKALAVLKKQEADLGQKMRTAAGNDLLWSLIEREAGRIEAERAQLTTDLAEIDRRLAAHDVAIDQLEALQTYCARVRAKLGTAGFAQKRQAVEWLIERVVANGTDWRIEGAVPTLAGAGALSLTSSCPGHVACLRFVRESSPPPEALAAD